MGIGKIVKQALGIEPKPVTPAPTVSEVAAANAAPEAAGATSPELLLETKELLEEKKTDTENKIEEINKQMSHADITPQPQIKGASTMDVKKEEAKKEEEKKEEGKPAAASTGPTSDLIQETAPVTVPETPKETAEAAKPTATAAFSMRFVQGTSFDNSYFVAEDGKGFFPVKASRIIPVSVQNKIIHALATTKEAPADVVSPTEILEQIQSQGVNTIEAFKAAMLELEASAKESEAGTTKQAGMMAWNESEVMKIKLPKPEEGPLMASVEAEAEAGKKMHPAPHQVPSKVKQYYGRLPSAGGGQTTQALNPNSHLLEKIEILRHALEEQKNLADAAKLEAENAKGEKDKLVKDKEDGEHSSLMESIVKDLVGKKLIDSKDESQAISLLSKVEKKSLAHVASLLKLLSKGGKGMDMMPALEAEGKKPPFGEEKQPKTSAQLPPVFLNEREPDIAAAPSLLAKFWDAK